MELFLYQLSIWGLTLTSLMIAVFFQILSRSNPRDEMRWWTYGWFANVAAMGITLVFWYSQPPAALHPFIFAVYLVAKNVYVWLLLRGTLEFQSWRPRALEARRVLPLIIAFSIAAVLMVTTSIGWAWPRRGSSPWRWLGAPGRWPAPACRPRSGSSSR